MDSIALLLEKACNDKDYLFVDTEQKCSILTNNSVC